MFFLHEELRSLTLTLSSFLTSLRVSSLTLIHAHSVVSVSTLSLDSHASIVTSSLASASHTMVHTHSITLVRSCSRLSVCSALRISTLLSQQVSSIQARTHSQSKTKGKRLKTKVYWPQPLDIKKSPRHHVAVIFVSTTNMNEKHFATLRLRV